MSFPKAKIHRFNEEITCAPPPGRYDPKVEKKVKGAALLTSKRFPNQFGISSSLECLDKVPTSHVTFRTPQVQRKVMLTPRLKHLKDANFDTPGSDSSLNSAKSEERLFTSQKEYTKADYHRLESELSALAEKHFNELHDRNLEIAKLKEDLKVHKIQEEEYKLVLKEKNLQEEERSKEVKELKTNLDTVVEKINQEREEHKTYINELQEQISDLQAKMKDTEVIIAQKQDVIDNINEKYLIMDDALQKLRDEKDKYDEEIIRIEKENVANLKEVIIGADVRLEEIETNFINKVLTISKAFYDAEEKIHVEYQSETNFLSHEFDKIQQEMEAEMKKCISKIKELEKTTDDYIKQFTKDMNEAEESCKYLYRELCKVEKERDELVTSDLEKKLTILDIQEKTDIIESELEQYRTKCKNYEITLNNMNETINALSSRLLSSENEVERLSNVEIDLVNQKKLLEEKSQLLLSDITALREGMDKMEKDIICDVVAMKENLAAKVDHFKAEAARQVEVLNNRVQEKQSAIDMLLRDNEHYRKQINFKDEDLKNLQTKLKEYNVEAVNLKSYCSKLEEEFNDKLKAQDNLCAILNDQLESTNRLINELKNSQLSHENQISVLNAEIIKYKSTGAEAQEKLSFRINENSALRNENSALSSKVKTIQEKIQSYQAIVEEKNKNEIKQKEYIDELVADLVLEKDQCIRLENERDEIIESKITAEEKLSKSQDYVEHLENNINELQDSLRSAKEEIKIEMPNLRHDNVNKAEYILDLSLKIDVLNETITKAETTISCLEAEKSSLKIQLDEIKITSEKNLSEKNNQVFNLTKELNFMKEQYCKSTEQNGNLHDIIQKRNEQLQANIDLPQKLHDLEEIIEKLNRRHNEDKEKCSIMQNTITELQVQNTKLNKLHTDISSKLERESKKLQELEEEFNKKEVNLNDNTMKLSEAKTTIQNMEKTINDIEAKSKSNGDEQRLVEENKRLHEELEEARLQLKLTSEARNKLDRELADLMGHHNINQKIKHVTHLKQNNAELREKTEKLEIENSRLKKKLDEFKENALVSQTPRQKSTLPPKQPLSPVVFNRIN